MGLHDIDILAENLEELENNEKLLIKELTPLLVHLIHLENPLMEMQCEEIPTK